MSASSPNLALPLVEASQAQKHVTHNEALVALDTLVHLAVVTRSLAGPPGTTADGDRYLVAGSGSGAWSGHGGEVAARESGTWTFHVPRRGWIAWISDEARGLAFDGTGWVAVSGTFERLGVNATADDTNRLAVGGPASLFDGRNGSHRLKVNKTAVADTASVLLQSGYSGRAEIGLTGTDDLSVNVSADGTTWVPAMSVGTSGRVGIGKTPGTMHPDVAGGIRSTSAASAYVQFVNSGASGTQAWIGIPDWNRSAFYVYGSQSDIMSMYDTTTRSHRLYGGGSERLRILTSGEVGIGTTAPSTRLHVAGPVRVGSYAKASLPAAATVGAGTLAYVTDASGGAQFGYSDGTNWLKLRDGAAV